MNNVVLIIILLTVLHSYDVSGANILFLMGPVAQSQFIWSNTIMNELANRGHNLTVLFSVNPFKPEAIHKNIHQIYIELPHDIEGLNLNLSNVSSNVLVGGFSEVLKLVFKKHQAALKTNTHRILLNYPDDFKFDLVLYEIIGAFMYLPLLHKFRYPPVISIISFASPSFFNEHKYPAYIPHFYSDYDVHMNFLQRLHNTAATWTDAITSLSTHIDREIQKHYDQELPSSRELKKKIILTLVNSHPSIHYAEYLPPNVIEVAGLHIFDAKPLPDHLEKFIENSKKGAILFSLGTSIVGKDIGLNQSQIMLDAMAQLPEYNFLWKSDFTNSELKVPPNVLAAKFLPQRDILGHPKIKVFVMQAGCLSLQEAIWRGVPMVTIPCANDNFRGSRQSVIQGIAEQVDFPTLSVDILRNTIQKVAEDPKYTQNVRALSVRFKDRPMKPLDTAIWWIEYVLRNPKPTHLRSPAADLNFLQANSLDVIFVFISIGCLILACLLKCINCVFHSCKKSKKVCDKKQTQLKRD